MEKYEKYYKYLEDLRKSGEVNMFSAARYLMFDFDILEKEANAILNSWIKNYSELAEKYGWEK